MNIVQLVRVLEKLKRDASYVEEHLHGESYSDARRIIGEKAIDALLLYVGRVGGSERLIVNDVRDLTGILPEPTPNTEVDDA